MFFFLINQIDNKLLIESEIFHPVNFFPRIHLKIDCFFLKYRLRDFCNQNCRQFYLLRQNPLGRVPKKN